MSLISDTRGKLTTSLMLLSGGTESSIGEKCCFLTEVYLALRLPTGQLESNWEEGWETIEALEHHNGQERQALQTVLLLSQASLQPTQS